RLECGRRVIADEPHGAASEARKPGHERRLKLRHEPSQTLDEWLVRFAGHARPIDDRASTALPQPQKWILSQERVTGDPPSPFHALKEERVSGVLGNLQECRHRRQEIRNDLLDDRHKGSPPRQLDEFFEGCLFHACPLAAATSASPVAAPAADLKSPAG